MAWLTIRQRIVCQSRIKWCRYGTNIEFQLSEHQDFLELAKGVWVINVGLYLQILMYDTYTGRFTLNYVFLRASQPEENFYTCAWSYDTEMGETLLIVAGLKGIIRVIETSHVTCRAVSEAVVAM